MFKGYSWLGWILKGLYFRISSVYLCRSFFRKWKGERTSTVTSNMYQKYIEYCKIHSRFCIRYKNIIFKKFRAQFRLLCVFLLYIALLLMQIAFPISPSNMQAARLGLGYAARHACSSRERTNFNCLRSRMLCFLLSKYHSCKWRATRKINKTFSCDKLFFISESTKMSSTTNRNTSTNTHTQTNI